MAGEPALYARMEMRVKEAEKQMAKFAKQLDGEMGKMERRTGKAAKDMETTMGRGFAKMKSYAAEAGKGIWAGIAAGGVAGIAASVQTVAQSFADLGREAKTAGIGVEDFQKWRYAADQNRIGIDAMVDAFKELNIRGDEYIKTGKGGGADAFAQIGMSPEDVKARLKDPSALMLEIIDRTKRLKDTAAGVRIFDELLGGQGGEQFTRLIDQGREGITATLREAEKMGPIVDENFIRRAEEVDKKFNQIATTIGGSLKAAIVDAVGALSAFISSWNELNDKSLSGIRSELDLLQKQRERANTIEAGSAQDNVGWVFGKSKEAQLAGITAREKELNDELERRKSLSTSIVPDAAPYAPYIPPDTKKGGKSDAEKSREKAAKATDRERKAVTDLIADLQFEASLVGKTALQKEQMIAVRHAGAAATAEQRAEIEQLIETTYKQSEAWDASLQRLTEINDTAREATGSIIQGMLNGESAAESLANALSNVADRLLNDVLDAIFKVNNAGGGGILGGILSAFGGGGANLDPWAGMRGFNDGGAIGPRYSTFKPELLS
ncbi:hypothetical protein [Brucella pseudogrignonensis]|uniref:hypothetical protein n=1 Tax=Brucella pseudogrignonensis TaxID=419475 RepID=UPI003ECEBCE7